MGLADSPNPMLTKNLTLYIHYTDSLHRFTTPIHHTDSLQTITTARTFPLFYCRDKLSKMQGHVNILKSVLNHAQ